MTTVYIYFITSFISICEFHELNAHGAWGLNGVSLCRYLYLLFDEDNFVHKRNYLFSTEGHLFPLSYSLHEQFGQQVPSVSSVPSNPVLRGRTFFCFYFDFMPLFPGATSSHFLHLKTLTC